MKKLFFVAGIIMFCAGCASLQNPFSDFYQDRIGGMDITKATGVILPTEEPKIFSGSNVDEDAQKMYENGYTLLGFSSFNSGDVGKDKLIAQARKVRAEVVVLYSHYTNTVSGVVPLTLPNNQIVTTTYNGMGNSSGNIYGSNGAWASYNGTSNSFGTATTTIYGTQTTYIPYSQNRYDYGASYWIKLKKPILGIMSIDLTSQQREKIGTNKGAFVSVVIKDSPAFIADIFKGDILTRINDDDVLGPESLQTLIYKNVGRKVKVTLIREEKTIIKDVQMSDGETIQDEKYGGIAERFRLADNKGGGFTKTAKVNVSKIIDGYQKSKDYGLVWETIDPAKKMQDKKVMEIVEDVARGIKEYAKKNQYKAIYSDKMANVNESEDLTDAITLSINGKK